MAFLLYSASSLSLIIVSDLWKWTELQSPKSALSSCSHYYQFLQVHTSPACQRKSEDYTNHLAARGEWGKTLTYTRRSISCPLCGIFFPNACDNSMTNQLMLIRTTKCNYRAKSGTISIDYLWWAKMRGKYLAALAYSKGKNKSSCFIFITMHFWQKHI